MAKSLGKVTVPIFARIGAKEVEIGKVELDMEVLPSGKVKPPTRAAFIRALKKVR